MTTIMKALLLLALGMASAAAVEAAAEDIAYLKRLRQLAAGSGGPAEDATAALDMVANTGVSAKSAYIDLETRLKAQATAEAKSAQQSNEGVKVEADYVESE